MTVLLCGLGHVGHRTFELLRAAGHDVVVVARDPSAEAVHAVRQAGATLHLGDARDEGLLLRAGLATARAVLAVTDSDLVNLSIAMDTRRHAPHANLVVRLYDAQLAATAGPALRIDRVLSTTGLAAPVFAGAALGHDALGLLALGGETLAVGDASGDANEVVLWRDGDHALVAEPLPPPRPVHRPIAVIPPSLRRLLAVVLAVIAVGTLVLQPGLGLSPLDALYLTITTLTTVGYGDLNFLAAPAWAKLFGMALMLTGATVMALLFSAVTDLVLTEKLATLWGGRPVPAAGHTIVVGGGGHIGERVVQHLLASGAEVVVIEDDGAPRLSADLRRAVATVDGDPRRADTLTRAGVATARALLALTDDDVTNLAVALSARGLAPSLRTAVRTWDIDLAARLRGHLGLDRALSISALAAPCFAAAADHADVLLALTWRGHHVVVRPAQPGEVGAIPLPGGAVTVTARRVVPASPD